MQGRMPQEIFQNHQLEQFPVRTVPRTGKGLGAAQTAAPMSKEDEQIVVDRLRELGYID
jgi:hypothetical protein